MDVFFYKQKTAYDMRISDWSSYVCSSDLLLKHCPSKTSIHHVPKVIVHTSSSSIIWIRAHAKAELIQVLYYCKLRILLAHSPRPTAAIGLIAICAGLPARNHTRHTGIARSEERRVGKECVRACRSRWSPSH